MRRCRQRSKRTNGMPATASAVKLADQWMGMGALSRGKAI
jgi:hypothetical protein